VVIAAMLATGTLQPDIVMLVPVGSMIIANAMNDRGTLLRGCHGHVGEIEAGLALGAEPATAVAPYVQSAVYASLLPRLDFAEIAGTGVDTGGDGGHGGVGRETGRGRRKAPFGSHMRNAVAAGRSPDPPMAFDIFQYIPAT
jgi:hypothetical protein